MEIKKSRKTITEAELVNFEEKIGHALPPAYRKFILTYNGGEPNPYYFKVPNWKYKQSLVNQLKGIDPGGSYVDLEEVNELLAGRLPDNFIAIGDDPGGNMILTGLEGASKGKIYFFDHENEPDDADGKLESYPNIYFLADDFDTFITNLKNENEL